MCPNRGLYSSNFRHSELNESILSTWRQDRGRLSQSFKKTNHVGILSQDTGLRRTLDHSTWGWLEWWNAGSRPTPALRVSSYRHAAHQGQGAREPCVRSHIFPKRNTIWDLDHKEGWMLKDRCFWTVVLEKTRESPLDCKEIQPVNPKGNKPWIFIGGTDAEAEAAILRPPGAKSQLMERPRCWERL